MKKYFAVLLFGLLSVTGMAYADEMDTDVKKQNQFQEYPLITGEVYKIFVKKGDGVTTVTFPSSISKIAGVNVALDDSRDFQISAKPGGSYFNLVANKDGAKATLTVVYNRKTYILYLIHDPVQAYSAVNFAGSSFADNQNGRGGSGVTPARLLSLIDLAKTYEQMNHRYPSEMRDISRNGKRKIFTFDRFKLELVDVFRFNREDTLVFKLLLHNPTDEEIIYDKFSFSAHVGGRTFYMSAADASGIMPPKSSTWAFFSITGTPEGGRANLSCDNDFLVGVTTKYMEEELAE